jgi:hypothetical protein
MPRYLGTKIVTNNTEFYAPIRRGKKNIIHYETPILIHPTISERMSITTATHIWKYGDRFYKLAHQYYNDVQYWWVIAWYNGIPTEANVYNGDVIEIPTNIQQILRMLRV